MTARSAAAGHSDTIRRGGVVLLTLVIAVVGAFPYHLLFAVPLAASVTLLGPRSRWGWLVMLVSSGMLMLGFVQAIDVALSISAN